MSNLRKQQQQEAQRLAIPPRLRKAAAKKAANHPVCENKFCGEEGIYRAPRSPDELHKWRYFCLDHVKEYNRSWNYYKDKSNASIEADILDDINGGQPTWPMKDTVVLPHKVAQHKASTQKSAAAANTYLPRTPKEQAAFANLKLPNPCPRDQFRKNYKRLAKQLHPDMNMDKSKSQRLDDEKSFKQINRDYDLLKPLFDKHVK